MNEYLNLEKNLNSLSDEDLALFGQILKHSNFDISNFSNKRYITNGFLKCYFEIMKDSVDSFSMNWCPNVTDEAFQNSGATFKRLASLSFRNCRNLSTPTYIRICDCKHLTSLTLQG